MNEQTYQALKIAIVSSIMQSDETVEEQMKVLTDILMFLEQYEKRNKGYEIRKVR